MMSWWGLKWGRAGDHNQGGECKDSRIIVSSDQVDLPEITNCESWEWACLFWSESQKCFPVKDLARSVKMALGAHSRDGLTWLASSASEFAPSGATPSSLIISIMDADLHPLYSEEQKQCIWVSHCSQSSERLTDATQRHESPEVSKHTTSVCVCVCFGCGLAAAAAHI